MLTRTDRKFPGRIAPAALAVVCISFLAVVAGCGSSKGVQPAPHVTMSANPASIAAGTTSTLSVTATNAQTVTVAGSDGSSYTLAADGGTQQVKPTATTTYTATASGSGGSATATATVTVTGAAPTVAITASPTSVTAGSSSTLTVTATNATSVTISGSDGTSYTLATSGGNQTVTPATTTTYTATATGPGGSVTATATVTVTAGVAPAVTLTADPTTITSGNSSTLTVTATNATAVTLTGTDGSSYTMADTGGTQSVTPSATTTYVATATGAGGSATANVTVTVTAGPPTVTITASPTSIASGGSSTLTVAATNATSVTVAGSDGSSYTLQPTGGTQTVSPTSDTTYTATATGAGGSVTATATVNIVASGSVQSIDHVIFMMQENHSFDNYFGMLDPYRDSNGWNSYDGTTYEVDGLTVPTEGSTTMRNFSNTDDLNGANITYPIFPLTSTCVDDESSAWEESYGDVNTYDFSTNRKILMNGFVHNGAGYDQSCKASGNCSGTFYDPTGERVMGYYTQSTLNYYYYMASQFALSDRWFSPVSSFTVDNRIATMTGGTTQGLTNSPSTDKLPQLSAETIFEELDKAGVSWKIYYTATEGNCIADDECTGGATANFPATEFDTFEYSVKYLYMKNSPSEQCTAPTESSTVVGDTTGSFCIDPTHIAPVSDPTYGYYADLKNNTLPSFAWISPGFANNDEHPGSGQSVLTGQAEVAKIINAFMASPEWANSVFFLSYDEGGGPYDHVPPVPGSTNINTDFPVGDATSADYPDISSIAVNPDQYNPCPAPNGTPTIHCDLQAGEPGMASTDAAANPNNVASGRGFAAQLGFRVPNMVISPFTKPHYVSHIPMDHTAVIKFVEDRFIGNDKYLTARDAAQPNLLDFFDFTNPPWVTPPTPPTPLAPPGNCNATHFGGGS